MFDTAREYPTQIIQQNERICARDSQSSGLQAPESAKRVYAPLETKCELAGDTETSFKQTVTDAVQDPPPLVTLKYKILESQSRDTVHKCPINFKPP
ncbi:hypothetical protein CDAR_495361 [Caerostris darwini]|uniref:Uncharacterized protein n=1 Tax=Caerostris darwini TaxID=1538125 RepID=A0AAV4UXY4_9ARAC|nr:hypothetical protein CDAR_495361 [Caerostris darwini]